MMTSKAIVAYSIACGLSFIALLMGWQAMQVPWLVDNHGQEIWLWKLVTDSYTGEFPGREVCKSHAGFCAAWRTATFLLTLALVPELLVLLALLFSWGFHHRKKTVKVVLYLLIATLALELGGTVLWWIASCDLHRIYNHKWYFVGGWHLVVLSGVANMYLLMLLVLFRGYVRPDRVFETNGAYEDTYMSYEDEDDDDEDESIINDDSDDISVPDTVPPEQVDFYVFNKRARRRELERLTGSTA